MIKRGLFFILFLSIYISSFGISYYDNLEWGITSYDFLNVFPNALKTTRNNVSIYKTYLPTTLFKEQEFIFVEEKLIEIRKTYDSSKVDSNKLKEIYIELVDDYGDPYGVPIEEHDAGLDITGNQWIFPSKNNTTVILRGLDYFDENGTQIESKLFLILIPKL